MLLRSKIRRLPAVHQATLKALIEHLARIAAKSEKNKMDPKNLAIVFGGVIFGEDDIPKGGDLLSVQTLKVVLYLTSRLYLLMYYHPFLQDTLMEDLIIHAHTLYDQPMAPNSPPLPPTPLGEPIPAFTYGSKTTKVTTVPPDALSSLLPQDFTPVLPARPNNSLHPSSRAPNSPSKSRAYPEKALPLTIPEQSITDSPPSHSPVSLPSDGRNSVLFPVQPEPSEGSHSSSKFSDELVGLENAVISDK